MVIDKKYLIKLSFQMFYLFSCKDKKSLKLFDFIIAL